MNDNTHRTDPRHTALLVMDFQNGILDRLEGGDPLVARVADAIAVVRRHGGHVGYVRVAFEDADYESFPATSRMATRVVGTGRAMHADSATTAIDQRVAPEPGDIVVRKTRVGAFSTTDLADLLSEREVSTLVLAGISTSGVVLSTVRDAHDRDYQVFVLEDACADPQPGVHEFLTETIFPRQADVIAVSDLEDLLAPTP